VIALGPLAGQSDKFGGKWDIKVGDWVVYGRYVGQRMTHKDVRLLMVDDDQIQGVLADPYALKIYA
jgi:co-chaperonin GroES (HSP10)